ncbi:MAG: mechanosensitive ion channel [Alphaproteobacteria bacterium]|nr:mechanosensitive ion channel [Alphaproteobacteria bacterium]
MELDLGPESEFIALLTFWGMRLLTAIAILIAGWVIGKWASNRIKSFKKLDDTLKSFLGGLAKYGILSIAFVAVLGQLGVQTASLLAVLGAAGLAIGLALQGTLSNVASGVMMLILRPFNVGDYIEAGSVSGTVKSLSLFATELATLDNLYVFAPNSQIWNSEIINYNRNKQRRFDLVNGIAYDEDIDKAIKAIKAIIDKEERIITTAGKEPVYYVSSLGDSSVNVGVRYWTATSDFLATKWDLTKATKEALDKAGISIPFPTRTLEFSPESVEALAASSKKKAA